MIAYFQIQNLFQIQILGISNAGIKLGINNALHASRKHTVFESETCVINDMIRDVSLITTCVMYLYCTHDQQRKKSEINNIIAHSSFLLNVCDSFLIAHALKS
jgi:hypothetical protein